VSTVGRDEMVIREYIRKQEQEDSGWTSSTCGSDQPPSRWPKINRGRVSDPAQAASSGSHK